MNLEIKLAVRRGDILRCQYLIAEAYNRHYEIFFSNDIVNLNARIEPYPDRYAMGTINGEIVATVGLYLQETYSEQYGGVTEKDIDRLLHEAGVEGRYSSKRKREFTKLVVRDDWEGRGLAYHFFKGVNCRDFFQLEAEPGAPHAIVCTAKTSIFRNLHSRAGITTRLIKPFPIYEVHSLYSNADDPMESRLTIPDLDIPPDIYEQRLPTVIEFTPSKGTHR